MTVCIAALCQWWEDTGVIHAGVVLASDRMITSREVREYQPPQTKVFDLTPSIKVLVSGDALALLEICRKTKSEVARLGLATVGSMAEVFRQQFVIYRTAHNEHRVLGQFGMDMNTFLREQRGMAPAIVQQIYDDLTHWRQSDLNATAIIAGADAMTGAHIYRVSDPGTIQCFDAMGFVAIGMGAEHAESEFIDEEYVSSRPWGQALVLAYAAKRRAQSAPGVGDVTDLYYVDERAQIYYGPDDPMQADLRRMYDARRLQHRLELIDDTTELFRLVTERGEAAKKAADEKARADQEASDRTDDEEGLSGGTEEGEPEG